MAKQHFVICVECGKQFDANKGGGYLRDSRRYVCKKCMRQSKKSNRNNTHIAKKYWKVVLGVILAVGGVSLIVEDICAAITGIVLGAALIAWWEKDRKLRDDTSEDHLPE